MHQLKLELCSFVYGLVFFGLAFCSSPASEDAKDNYVVPDNKCTCTSAPCHTLQYYAENQAQYFVSEATFFFLPGEHSLSNGTNITVKGASNITLIAVDHCGHYEPIQDQEPVINCSGGQAGLSFADTKDIEISGIHFINCGQMVHTTKHNVLNQTYVDVWSATLSLKNVTNFRLSNSSISQSHGYGILADGVYGNSSIEGCHIEGNRGEVNNKFHFLHGGNIGLKYNKSCQGISHFDISNSEIRNGYSVSYASGVDLVLYCTVGAIHVELYQVILSNNIGRGGGNETSSLSVQLLVFPNQRNSNTMYLNECQIKNTDTETGRAMSVSIYIGPNKHEKLKDNKTFNALEVIGSKFQNNTSGIAGSALEIKLYYTANLTSNQVGVLFNNCLFENNALRADTLQQSGGIAVNIIVFRVGASTLHSVPQFQTVFTSCNFTNNHILNHPSVGSGVIYIEEHSNIMLENCTISGNNCTGITAVHSYLCFRGHNAIVKNEAVSGGGILLADNAVLLLTENSFLNISHNKAKMKGGGIYVEYGSTSAIPLCFFQFETDVLLNKTRRKMIRVNLHNNSAQMGKAVYGGQVDKCYFLVHNTPWINKNLLSQKSGKIFNESFEFENSTKAISSDAVKVCFCENRTANCTKKTIKLSITPGENVTLNVSVVGQRNGETSGFVVADFNVNGVRFVNGKAQQVNMTCTELNYTLLSNRNNTSANLFLNVPESNAVGHTIVEMNITFCPLAFELVNNTSQCSCVKGIKKKNCNPEDHSIFREAHMWIGYNKRNNSYIPTEESNDINENTCPNLYCIPKPTKIKACANHIEQDSQCYLNRSGVLCGQCHTGHSIVFGTPRCIDCRSHTLWSTFGMLLAFAVAGVVLVIFLLVSNFTVTQGTINGFILYANIIEACQDTYFPLRVMKDAQVYRFLRGFIAWLNLDIGIEVCFFNGMKTFHKTLLQFVFPIYIWLITGLLIWLSRRYTLATRLMKHNGTKVLATLVLLSYAKLIRTIRTCLSAVSIGSQLFWFYDASEVYCNGRHILLLIIAIVFIVILLPYTLALLFIKQLPRLTSVRAFHWLHKLKPFFDAYTGPYKDKYRFWVGMQLVIRIFILCCTTLTRSDTNVLLEIIGACIFLLSANYFYGNGIYKKRSININEALLLLNLSLWSMIYISVQDKLNSQYNLVYTFVGLAFVQFCAVILCFHTYKPACCLRFKEKCWQHIEGMTVWRYFQQSHERVHLLEDSATLTVGSYNEVSSDTASFQSARNEMYFS